MRLTGMADCNTELQARIVDQTKLFDDIADEARPGFRSASEASSYYPKSQQLPQVKRLLEDMKELRDLRTAAPNILGIIESKGLEFDDVAVVGFFSLAAEPFLLAMRKLLSVAHTIAEHTNISERNLEQLVQDVPPNMEIELKLLCECNRYFPPASSYSRMLLQTSPSRVAALGYTFASSRMAPERHAGRNSVTFLSTSLMLRSASIFCRTS